MSEQISEEVVDCGTDNINIKYIHYVIISNVNDKNRFDMYENGKLEIENVVSCKGYNTIFSFCDSNKDLYIKNYERFLYTFKDIRGKYFQISCWGKLVNNEIVDVLNIECDCKYIKNDKDDMDKQVMGGQL